MNDAQRGFAFCDELVALVHRLGPPNLAPAELEELATHLLETALAWSEARTAAAKNPQ